MATSLPSGWLERGHGSIALHVRGPLHRKKTLHVRVWTTIKDIKDQLQIVWQIPNNAQRLYHKGRELRNAHNLQQCGIYRDSAVIELVGRRRNPNVDMQFVGAHIPPPVMLKCMHQALQGLALGMTPELAMDGTGGTYFLRDMRRRAVCCFKPRNEEPFAPNNPRGFIGMLGQSGLRKGILSGEACDRELAAYLLDHSHVSNVPATCMVEAQHPVFRGTMPSVGSLQEFVSHQDVASDVSPSQFPAHQVHKIALLDMRILNTDRNDANILVQRDGSSVKLIPIDHGYSLPEFLEIAWCDWCWYHWPQLQVPLRDKFRKYVLALDINADLEMLEKRIVLRTACRRNLIIANMVVRKGVERGVLLYDIARIMCREELDVYSRLENECLRAFEAVMEEKGTIEDMNRILDANVGLEKQFLRKLTELLDKVYSQIGTGMT